MNEGAKGGRSGDAPRAGALRVPFWNGLARDGAWFRNIDRAHDLVLIAEPREEFTYVRHHQGKLAFQLTSLRRLKADLEACGVRILHMRVDDDATPDNWTDCVHKALKGADFDRIIVSEPPDVRLQETVDGWARAFEKPVDVVEDDHFFCTREEFREWAQGRSGRLLMETFYREMRKNTGILMDEAGEPVGGKWNYDHDNRKPLKAGVSAPERPFLKQDTLVQECRRTVGVLFGDHFGRVDGHDWPTTPEEARKALEVFIEKALPDFGDYQDALKDGEGGDFLFHSLLSPALNHGLLTPKEVCDAAEEAYQDARAPLNAVEGFIRQILGWREYVRGVYWLHAEDYGTRNHFGHDRALPDFYWTGETDMRCLAEAVRNTYEHAYAHHIQRLMITGNFALLAGVDPDEVDAWYLSVYADAFEWVEMPNARGMSQHADGGIMATKPYVSGGNYINKMSDHCKHCAYDVKEKIGRNACPFNYLYWDFLARHEDKLRGTGRLNRVYATWDKMDAAKKNACRQSARRFFERLDGAAGDQEAA